VRFSQDDIVRDAAQQIGDYVAEYQARQGG
jgi:hypothetical protein